MSETTESRAMFGNLLASRPKREGKAAAAAGVTSTVVHIAIVGLLVWVTMAVGQDVPDEEEITMLIPVEQEEPPPPPPPPPPEPDAPEPVPQEQVEVPKGFLTLTPPEVIAPDIPPPNLGVQIDERDFTAQGVQGGRSTGTLTEVTEEDIAAAPTFTPYTVKPELRNTSQVASALQRNYPALLRDAGIGGTTIMWFFIDENGKVLRTQVFKTSGYDALDGAASKVAEIMEFTPALNRDKKVQVWVQIPITFSSR
jgi:protein TonB